VIVKPLEQDEADLEQRPEEFNDGPQPLHLQETKRLDPDPEDSEDEPESIVDIIRMQQQYVQCKRE
jgi:hypothetical protein